MRSAVAAAVLMAVGGCTSYDGPAGRRGGSAAERDCVDLDQDGYGRDCGKGSDCDDHDPAAWSGAACSVCAFPDEGCACEPGSDAVSCFVDKTVASDGGVMCHEGTRYCRQGRWSACEDVHSYEMPASAPTTALVVPDAAPVNCNDCNVKCFVIRDNLDPVDGGLTAANSANAAWASGGGLGIGTVAGEYWYPPAPDGGYGTGPVHNPDEGAQCVVGTGNDYDCDGIVDTLDPYPSVKPFQTTTPAIFLDVAAGETGTGVIDLIVFVKTMDVYFLIDATKSMQSVHTKLQDALVVGTFLGPAVTCADTDLDGLPNNELKDQGLIGAIRCLIRDAWTSAGYFREIPFTPYGDIDEITYKHLVDLTQNPAFVKAAIDGIGNQRDRDWPDAAPMALYSLATGNGHYTGLTRPGVPPRTHCPSVVTRDRLMSTWGYPCFRSEAFPVVVMFTDAPMHNGALVSEPSYQYPMDYDPAKLGITAGSTAAYLSAPITNETLSTALEVGDAATQYVTYAGDTRPMVSDYGAGLMSCLAAGSDGAPDAAYTFTLSTTQGVTLSTAGSDFAAALGLYSHAAESPRMLSTDTSNEDWLTPYDVKDLYTQWKVVSGTTAGMTADYPGTYVSCTADGAAPDAVFEFSLLRDTLLRLDSTGSAFDTVLSLHTKPPVLAETTTTNNLNNVGSTAQNLGDVYRHDVTVTGGDTSAATIGADYTELQVGCTAHTQSPDAVYRFSLSEPTRIRVSSAGSAFDTVLALTDGDFGSPTDVSVAATNETQASAYDAGFLIGAWKRLFGTTLGMSANYRDAFIGCGAGTSSPDAVFKFTLLSDTRVRIDTTGSGFDTVVSLHNGAIDPVTPVSNTTNTNEVASSALALGSANDAWYEVSGASTTDMSADYVGDTIGCGASDLSPDAVYSFTVASTTRVRVDTEGSSYDTMLSLHDAQPPYHVTVPLSPTPELYDLGSINGSSRVLTGDTTPLASNYGGLSMGCGAYDATPDAVFKFRVDAPIGVEINTAGTTWDTAIGLYPTTIMAPKEPPPTVVPNTNETKATATNAGAIDASWQVFTGSTAQMAADTGWTGCSAAAIARDAFFKFSLSSTHNVRVETGGSAFDTVIGVFRDADDSLVACDNDSGPGETDVLTTLLQPGPYYVVLKGDGPSDKGPYKLSIRDLDAANVIVCDDDLGGNGTSKIIAQLTPGDYHVLLKGKTPPADGPFKIRLTDRDWFAVKRRLACDDNSGGVSDSLIERDLAPGTYYAIVKGDFATERGPYKLRARDVSSAVASSHLVACNDDGLSPPVSRIEADLTAGTYHVVLKGKGTTSGAYNLTLRDLGAAALGERIDCNDDEVPGVTQTSLLERDLGKGNYFVYVKGGDFDKKGPYQVRVTDVTNAMESRLACDDDGAGGTASRIEQSLTAGKYWAILKGGAAAASGDYSLTFRDMNSTMRQTLACETDGQHTATLEPGAYDVVVKGTTSAAKGRYAFTVGNGQTMAATFAPPAWSTTRGALVNRDVRVINVLNCHDNGVHGDGRECDDAHTQAIELANATDALAEDFSPLVFDIDANGTGLENAVITALDQLTRHLELDIGVRVAFEPDANPGFGVTVSAVDRVGDGCDGLVGVTHYNCRPDATPTFHLRFTNPYNNPIPLNPNDPKGGYSFRADLIADGKYFVEQVPIYVVPKDLDGSSPGAEGLLYGQGTYWQDLTFRLGCQVTELPDWSDLSWTASLPSGTSIEFAVCTASTAEGLADCTPASVARIVGSGACTMDSQCPQGFCAQGACQTITSGTCVGGSTCALGSTCVNGTCVYARQPVYVGGILGANNLKPYLRMQTTFTANVSANDTPTLYDWALTYLCRGNL